MTQNHRRRSPPGPKPKARSTACFSGSVRSRYSSAPSAWASIMIISMLERRSEIGLRRVLGATGGQIRTRFLSKVIIPALLGDIARVLAGTAATVVFASTKRWGIMIPAEAWPDGIAAAIAIGSVIGLLPALRAARPSPSVALRAV